MPITVNLLIGLMPQRVIDLASKTPLYSNVFLFVDDNHPLQSSEEGTSSSALLFKDGRHNRQVSGQCNQPGAQRVSIPPAAL
ncbi:uncharacterized [Tachysurus ichikawai]